MWHLIQQNTDSNFAIVSRPAFVRPKEVREVRRPLDVDRAHYSSKDFSSIYYHHIVMGLKLPLDQLTKDILIHYNLSLLQLTPNAVRTIIWFRLICIYYKILPILHLF